MTYLPDLHLEVEWNQVQHSCLPDWPNGKPILVLPGLIPEQVEPRRQHDMIMNEQRHKQEVEPESSETWKIKQLRGGEAEGTKTPETVACFRCFSWFWLCVFYLYGASWGAAESSWDKAMQWVHRATIRRWLSLLILSIIYYRPIDC